MLDSNINNKKMNRKKIFFQMLKKHINKKIFDQINNMVAK